MLLSFFCEGWGPVRFPLGGGLLAFEDGFAGDAGLGIQRVDVDLAGAEFDLRDILRGDAFDRHNERAEGVAVGGDEGGVGAEYRRQDLVDVVRQHAGDGVAQALAARGGRVVGAAPDVDLLLAELLAGLVLIQAGEVAVVALVERLITRDGDGGAEFVQHDIAGCRGALQHGAEGGLRGEACGFEALAGGGGFLSSLLGEREIRPAGELVAFVAFGLAVAGEDEGGHDVLLYVFKC